MSDTWNDIQALKNRQTNLRAKMMERRKQREGLAAELTSSGAAPVILSSTHAPAPNTDHSSGISPSLSKMLVKTTPNPTSSPGKHMKEMIKMNIDPEVEKKLLMVLCDISLDIPSDSKVIAEHTSRLMEREVDLMLIEELLRKFSAQKLISIKISEGMGGLIVNSLDLSKLSAMTKGQSKKRRRDSDDEEEEDQGNKQSKTVPGTEAGDIESLLSMQSTKEREEKRLNEEIQALLVTQTAKEQYLVEKFKSRGGPQLQEFCQYGTREECQRSGPEGANCKRLHFKKIIHKHTDESLGDCSFLNTCFHMDTCKDPSNMAANMAGTPQQQIQPGQMQQMPGPGWFYDYDNSSISSNLYPGQQQPPPLSRPFPPSHVNNQSNISAGSYPPSALPDTSNSMSGRNFSAASPLVDQVRPSYPNNNTAANASPMSGDPARQANMSAPRDISVRPYLPSNNPITIADTIQPPGGMLGSHHHGPSRGDARNITNRPYPPISGADSGPVPLPLLSEMPSTSAYPYSSIPYSLTAPPPGPSASAVPPQVPFTQIGENMSPFDQTAPVISYAWSLSGDLFPTTISPAETGKHSTKSSKSKSGSAGKKRMRRPEMWKKNLTKSKKLKGEEHVSRTGNVIPAKRVESVDCSQCSFKCNDSFIEDLRQQLFEVFYSLGSNESQKQFVCQNVTESATKVTGAAKKEEGHENKRKVCRKYFLPDTDNTRKQVCSKFFCGTLAIGKTFITHALKNKQFGCYVGKEKRGKPHNKIPDMLLDPARQHITTMLAGSSGSGAKKVSKKKCLERGLNITKMHEMYKQECSENGVPAISLSMYRRIFHTEF